jgi:hypothetical protein
LYLSIPEEGKMKRFLITFLILVLASPLVVLARDHGNNDGNSAGFGQRSNDQSAQPQQDRHEQSNQQPKQQAPKHEAAKNVQPPVVINMAHPSSGGHNRNYPSQQSAKVPQSQQPSYGQVHWTPAKSQNKPKHNPGNSSVQPSVQGIHTQSAGPAMRQQSVKDIKTPGMKAVNAIHHHQYTEGYVRKKLQKLGVKSEPNYITNRSEVIHTDRVHSMIQMPKFGMNKESISATVMSSRNFNDLSVRNHMSMVSNSDWQARIRTFNHDENRANQYYWHKDKGFNYCHYIDDSGYHWYGWYVGNHYFWNRYYSGRWWWYDADFDRWCFWNNNFWWWQDPYHMGDLYCYDNDVYIPANSDDDQVVVTEPDNSSMQSFSSPDGSRMVKIDNDTQDAFLYDTAVDRTFDPVYLASGVKSVQFSTAGVGSPLEIILTLNDGSFDMFDGLGNAYNITQPDSGASEN